MVQDLPGCVAAGETVEEVRRLITEAITLHLDLMAHSGEKIPKPSQRMEFVIDEASEDEEFCTWVEARFPTNRRTSKKRIAGTRDVPVG